MAGLEDEDNLEVGPCDAGAHQRACGGALGMWGWSQGRGPGASGSCSPGWSRAGAECGKPLELEEARKGRRRGSSKCGFPTQSEWEGPEVQVLANHDSENLLPLRCGGERRQAGAWLP